MRYMIYLPAEGRARLIRCGANGSLTLNELWSLLDGYVETAPTCLEPTWAREPADGVRLLVNEEGKLRELPLNQDATLLYKYRDRDVILGNALLCVAAGEELLGFRLPAAKTICEEFGIDMEDDVWKD